MEFGGAMIFLFHVIFHKIFNIAVIVFFSVSMKKMHCIFLSVRPTKWAIVEKNRVSFRTLRVPCVRRSLSFAGRLATWVPRKRMEKKGSVGELWHVTVVMLPATKLVISKGSISQMTWSPTNISQEVGPYYIGRMADFLLPTHNTAYFLAFANFCTWYFPWK